MAEFPSATGPIESAVATRAVDSVKIEFGKMFITTTPNASLPSTNTVRFLAPRRRVELIVTENTPFVRGVNTADG